MTFLDSAGNPLTQAALEAKTTIKPAPAQVRIFTDNVYETVPTPGEAKFGTRRILKYAIGDEVPQADIDAAYVAATVTAISPATGAAAGGTAVTITGTNLGGSTGASVGGVALTSFKVISETKVTGVTGAHAAGAVAVSVTDDSGTQSAAGTPFTYV